MYRNLSVIFLDIDGVMNNTQTIYNNGAANALDPDAMRLLNKLVENTGANIVITSLWRLGHSLYWIQKMFESQGFHYPERIIGATMELPNQPRGEEIALWLKQVPVNAFVILDDNGMGNREEINAKLILTEMTEGLQPQHVERAERMLREQWE